MSNTASATTRVTYDAAGATVEIHDLTIIDPAVTTEALRWTTGARGPARSASELDGADLTAYVTQAIAIGAHAITAAGGAQDTFNLEQLVQDVAQRTTVSATQAAAATNAAVTDATKAITEASSAATKALTEANSRRARPSPSQSPRRRASCEPRSPRSSVATTPSCSRGSSRCSTRSARASRATATSRWARCSKRPPGHSTPTTRPRRWPSTGTSSTSSTSS